MLTSRLLSTPPKNMLALGESLLQNPPFRPRTVLVLFVGWGPLSWNTRVPLVVPTGHRPFSCLVRLWQTSLVSGMTHPMMVVWNPLILVPAQ